MSTVLIIDDPNTAQLDVIVADGLGAGELTDDGFLTTHGDANATLGLVQFGGMVGSFDVLLSLGLTDPLLPVGGMDLNVQFLRSTGAGELELMLTTTDVDLGTGIVPATFSIGGVTASEISAQATVDPDGREFGIGGNPQTVGTLGTFSGGGFSGEDSTMVPVSNDSSLTISVDVTADGAGEATGFDAFLGVGVSVAPACIGDFVWEDLNANGIQDADELDDGINGATVKLLADADGDGEIDDVVATTTTGDNPENGLPGYYKFADLTPGVQYQVMFNNPDPDGPDAYMFSPRQAGGDPAVDSDGPMSDVVVLSSGEFNDTIDAGLFRKGSIHVFGYEDKDGDGNFDPEDEAFPDDPGKTFELLDENGNVIMTDSTMDGMVWFEGLTPGTYTVRENPISGGFSLTTQPNERTFTIISGEELVYEDGAAMLPEDDQRFETNLGDDLRWGNTELACIGDLVFDDLNGNGIQDAGEAGVAGVTVTLTGGGADGVIGTGGDDTTAELTTDANGEYKFAGLNPGEEYKVTFSDLPEGFVFTQPNQGGDDEVDSDADPTNGMTQIVTLESGEYNDTLDAGILETACIGDLVFEDANGNGIQDAGEAGVAGVTVTLTGGGADGVIGTGGDDTTAELTTDANGEYKFAGLNPGEEYKVTFSDLPEGFVFTQPNQGGDDGVDSDADPTNGMTQIVTLESGEYNDTLDAGILETACIGDLVFEDANGNGIQDAGEAGVAGVTVTLTGGGADGVIGTGGDDTTAELTTDANGEYKFAGLNPGEEYKVTFSDLPEGFVFTQPNQGGDDEVDSDADPTNGMTQIVTLESGEYNDTLDAGILETACIGDLVFEDANGNGIQDAGEAGVAGVTVTLTGGGADGVIGTGGDDTTAELTTDANGEYKFAGLNPGEEYKVTFSDLPEGFVFTQPNQGGDDEVDSDADPTNGMTQIVTLESGEYNNTLDAGITSAGDIDIEKFVCVIPGDFHDGKGSASGSGKGSGSGSGDSSGKSSGSGSGKGSGSGSGDSSGKSSGSGSGDSSGKSSGSGSGDSSGKSSGSGSGKSSGKSSGSGSGKSSGSGSGKSSGKSSGSGSGKSSGSGSGKSSGKSSGDGSNSHNGDKCEKLTFSAYLASAFGLTSAIDEIKLDDETGFDWGKGSSNGSGSGSGGSGSGSKSSGSGGSGSSSGMGSGGSGDHMCEGPGKCDFQDADDPTGPIARPGDKVLFKYAVTTGDSNVPLSNVVVTDDRVETIELTRDGFNVGDTNQNDLLDSDETWLYAGWEKAKPAQQMNTGKAVGTPEGTDTEVMDTDKAHYVGQVIDIEKLVCVEDGMGSDGGTGKSSGSGSGKSSGSGSGDSSGKSSGSGSGKSSGSGSGDSSGKSSGSGSGGGSDGSGNGSDDSGSGDFCKDADTAKEAVEVTVGEKVVFTYVVTNLTETPISNVKVVDDNRTPDDPSDDFNPDPVLSDGGFNIGDKNHDNLLDPDETWLYASSETAIEGLQTNKGTVTGSFGEIDVMDMDFANYEGVEFTGDLCDEFGKPVKLAFDYNPGTDVDTGQEKASAEGVPDEDGESYIVVGDKKGEKTFFAGTVKAGEQFTADAESSEKGRFDSNTAIQIFDDFAAFENGDDPLQTLGYHTSCSQPIELGDVIGSVELVGYAGEDGTAGDLELFG